ncbi:MAG: hypothetical protein ACO22D_04150 [Schleiferiaceae bacterium]
MPTLLFRNAHPGVAVVLIAVATALAIGLNTLLLQPIPLTLALATGVAAWFFNFILVYRSRYLKMNYLYGWLWFVAVFALSSGRQGIQWHTLGGSLAAATWMALAYEMSQDERSALTRRINLGFVTGLLLLWNVRFSYFIIVSLWAIGWGTARSGRGFLQLLLGWLVPAVIIATYHWTIAGPAAFQAWIAPLRPQWAWFIPSPGEWVLFFWLLLAIPQTLRAAVSAKRTKRQGLYLSWSGILVAVIWRIAHPDASTSGLLAVFATPQLLNLQDYLPKYWMRVILGHSLLAGGLLSVFVR